MAPVDAGLKRPSSSDPTFKTRNVRRKTELTSQGNEYTDEEHNALQRAAALLGTTVQDLLEQHKPTSNIGMTDDDVSTSINESFLHDDIDSFELKTPRFTRRSYLPFGSDPFIGPWEPNTLLGSGPIADIIPWLSSCPSMEQEAAFSFPSIEELYDQPPPDGLVVGVGQNPNTWSEMRLNSDWTSSSNTLPLTAQNTAYGGNSSEPQGSADSFPLLGCDASFPTHLTSSTSVETETSFTTRDSLKPDSTIAGAESRPSRENDQRRHSTGTRAKRRGPFQDPDARRRTAQTRIYKACIRCSMQRDRCEPDPNDPSGCCLTCLKVAGATLSRLPCLRYKISNAQLIDHGTCPRLSWSSRWKEMKIVEIDKWRSSEVKIIHVTQDVGNAWYQLKVREFVPVEGDVLERKWVTDGKQQSFECAPYAIANMEETGHDLIRFADNHLLTALCYYTGKDDGLLRNTYDMACQCTRSAEREQERTLLRNVLRFWCALRMESRSDRIFGKETLGMKPQDYDPKCSNWGKILLPPVLNAQMEVIVTEKMLLPLKKAVLKGLETLLKENKRELWFTIYLSIFILLHSCALLTAADMKRARKYGMQSRYFKKALIEELHEGANVLLAYFHYSNKGIHPFSADWKSPDIAARAKLTAKQASFMHSTAEQIAQKAPIFKKIRDEGEVENELYFIAQLYDRDWKPS